MSVLSTGPVGIGDRINYTNVSLVAATCMSNGTLLKPSRPLAAIDAVFGSHGYAVNGGASVQQAPVWLDCSVGTRGPSRGLKGKSDGAAANACTALFSTILVADAASPVTLWPSDLTPDLSAAARLPGSAGEYVAMAWSPGFAALRAGCVNCSSLSQNYSSYGPCTPSSCKLRSFADTSALTVTTGAAEPMPPQETGQPRHPFELLSLSPVFTGGFALLGEVSKFSRVSVQRFPYVILQPGGALGLVVGVAGAPFETVEITMLVPAGGSLPGSNILSNSVRSLSTLNTLAWTFNASGGIVEISCIGGTPGCLIVPV